MKTIKIISIAVLVLFYSFSAVASSETYTVTFKGTGPQVKLIETVKIIKAFKQSTLKVAYDIVKNPPSVITDSASKEQATKLVIDLANSGSLAELTQNQPKAQ